MRAKKYYMVPASSFYQSGIMINVKGPDHSCGFMIAYTNKHKAEAMAKRMGIDKHKIITMEQEPSCET